nr:hypothetical protein [Tanacetum cinerariifolium]
MNKLVRHNLVRGLPTKSFDNDHTCTACLKGKQHKASCKSNSQNNIDDKGYWDNGCSRHMTGNISYLSNFEPSDGGYVSFGQGGCRIIGKGTIKTECIVLRRNFKLLNDANILLRTPRRLGHLNVKTRNKLVRHNLVRGLPTKSFDNDHTCTTCLKGKQHKASCKSKLVNSVTKPLHTLHMDLFGPTSISSISHKWYCLVVTDDFSRKPKGLKPFDCHVMILNTLDNLGKFEAKGDEVDAGTNSTNLSGTKDAANQEVKKDVSSLRYIVLPNWAHDDLLEFSSSKPYDESNSQVHKGSGNPNPTVSSSNPPADQMETLTVESPIPTVSSPVPTTCLNDSQEPSSEARLISKRVANQEETPSMDNILSLTNWFEDTLRVTTSSDEIIGVEAGVSNMETSISASPTLTLRIHKDHPKSQIIGSVDTQIQTRHKSKMMEEQSFIATIHQKTDPALLQFLYQMDVKSAFFYGTIDEEVYVMQPPRFQDPAFPAK